MALGDLIRTIVVPAFMVLIIILIVFKVGNSIWDTWKELRAKAQERKARKAAEKAKDAA